MGFYNSKLETLHCSRRQANDRGICRNPLFRCMPMSQK